MMPPRLIYLHGFRSSPASFKARWLGQRMAAAGLAERYVCPQLPASPAQAIDEIQSGIRPRREDVLVGSSLGGYYATWLAEQLDCRAVLLNPAVDPARGLAAQVGSHTMFHSDDPFEFKAGYIDELRALKVASISAPQRYFLIAATGDEVLDWREMVAHYPGARHRIIEGSDHGLSDFPGYGDEVLAFAGPDFAGSAFVQPSPANPSSV